MGLAADCRQKGENLHNNEEYIIILYIISKLDLHIFSIVELKDILH